MAQLFTNNAASHLAATLINSATGLAVTAGDGALFPSPSSPDYFYATVEEGTTREIVKVTGRSTDRLTPITRAADGSSTPASFSTAATVQLRVTKAAMQQFVQQGASVLTPYIAGDTLYASANDTLAKLAIGVRGAILRITSSTLPGWLAVGSKGSFLTSDGTDPSWTTVPGLLWGLTLTNDGSDATNDLDIAVGSAADATNADTLTLASALVKQTDVAWAVGTNAGGLDTGAVGNSTYHVWLIKRTDTGVVDALFSLSATAPTMPASYTLKRRIGSIVRAGGAIKLFVQDGDKFVWKVPVTDVTAANPGTSAVTRTLTVPTGIRVEAIVNVAGAGTGSAGGPGAIFVSDLSITDTGASINVFSIVGTDAAASASYTGATVRCFTNTSAQVRSRLGSSDATTTLYMNTEGWIDRRGRDA